MKRLAQLTILFFLLNVVLLNAAELKPEARRAWDDYIVIINSVEAERNSGNKPFLLIDESPETLRRVQQKELVITNHDPRKVPQGLIHHWVGVMFLPNVSLDHVMAVLNSYDRYGDIYKPLIRKASVIEQHEDSAKVTILAAQKAFSTTAAVETDEEIQIVKPAPNRVCIMANSASIREIANYGKPNEHVFQEEHRPGYIWRASIVQRLEERDGGVYVELETITLSRGIPVEVRWLIKPLTDDLPRKMMTDILDQTRTEVQRSTTGR